MSEPDYVSPGDIFIYVGKSTREFPRKQIYKYLFPYYLARNAVIRVCF